VPRNEALVYLLGRRWPSSNRLAGLLLLGSLLSWLNLKLVVLVPQTVTLASSHAGVALLWGVFVMLGGLLAISTTLALLLGIPLYSLVLCGTTLHSWIQGRVLGDLWALGWKPGPLVDTLLLHALRWCLRITGPSLLTAVALFPELRGPWLLPAALAFPLVTLAIGYGGLSLLAWAPRRLGSEAPPPMLHLPLLLAWPLPPLVMLGRLGFTPGTVLLAALWMALTARYLGLQGLDPSAGQPSPDHPVAPRARRHPWPENPIAARESARPPVSPQARRLMALTFLLVSALAFCLNALWLLAWLLLVVVLGNSFSICRRMAGSLDCERERGTLELLLSTPLSWQQYLRGWWQALVRPCWLEHAAMWVATALLFLLAGRGQELLAPWQLTAAALALLLPPLSAFTGAAIAGHAGGQARLSRVLLLSYALMLASAPPLLLALTAARLLAVSTVLGLLGMTTLGSGWFLNASARRSLGKLFSPLENPRLLGERKPPSASRNALSREVGNRWAFRGRA
jgi:hypothetical protein